MLGTIPWMCSEYKIATFSPLRNPCFEKISIIFEVSNTLWHHYEDFTINDCTPDKNEKCKSKHPEGKVLYTISGFLKINITNYTNIYSTLEIGIIVYNGTIYPGELKTRDCQYRWQTDGFNIVQSHGIEHIIALSVNQVFTIVFNFTQNSKWRFARGLFQDDLTSSWYSIVVQLDMYRLHTYLDILWHIHRSLSYQFISHVSFQKKSTDAHHKSKPISWYRRTPKQLGQDGIHWRQ